MIAEAAKPSAEESSRVQELQAKLASVSAKLAGKVGQHLCVCVCVCVCLCAQIRNMQAPKFLCPSRHACM